MSFLLIQLPPPGMGEQGGMGIIFALVIFAAIVYFGLIMPLRLLGYVNSVKAAQAFASHYHAQRATPFTASDESELIKTLMRQYELSTETAAEIAKQTMPAHGT